MPPDDPPTAPIAASVTLALGILRNLRDAGSIAAIKFVREVTGGISLGEAKDLVVSVRSLLPDGFVQGTTGCPSLIRADFDKIQQRARDAEKEVEALNEINARRNEDIDSRDAEIVRLTANNRDALAAAEARARRYKVALDAVLTDGEATEEDDD